MSDYLSNMIAHSRGKADMIEPRLPSLFEQSTQDLEFPTDEPSIVREPPANLQRSVSDSVLTPPSSVAEPAFHSSENQQRDIEVRQERGDSPDKVSADLPANSSIGAPVSAHLPAEKSSVPPDSISTPETPGAPASIETIGRQSARQISTTAPHQTGLHASETANMQPVKAPIDTRREPLAADSGTNVTGTVARPAIVPLAARAGTQPEKSETPPIEPSASNAVFGPASVRPASSIAGLPASLSNLPIPPAQDAPPTIRVNIGRIDVVAVQPPTPQPKPRQPQRPALSLHEYLDRRRGGSR